MGQRFAHQSARRAIGQLASLLRWHLFLGGITVASLNIISSSVTHPINMHWTIPTKIILAFLAGVAIALGHHLFYQQLDGQIAPTGEYVFGRSQLSKQQFNIAVGTAFAFLVKSSLTLAITCSWIQLFWFVLKRTSTRPLLVDMDHAFSLLQDIRVLFRFSMWHRDYILLIPVAIIFW